MFDDILKRIDETPYEDEFRWYKQKYRQAKSVMKEARDEIIDLRKLKDEYHKDASRFAEAIRKLKETNPDMKWPDDIDKDILEDVEELDKDEKLI